MSQAVTPIRPSIDPAMIEQVIMRGDLSGLTQAQRATYYATVCQTLGLNPLTKPFDYITLNGKLVLYANKGCAEQLRMIHRISIQITARETIEGVYVITARAKYPDGREDESTGAVSITGLKGEVLANAMLKSETKAKRRVTLSICGLNMLDETEVEDIPEAKKARIVASEPEPGDGFQKDTGYYIPFGKYARRKLEEIDVNDLRGYVEYLERSAEKKGVAMTGQVLEFFDRACAHIAAFENAPLEQADDEPVLI